MHFFSQLVFKITKVVSLKMVTNMYRYLGENVHPNICKLVSTEISVWREIIHSINIFPDKTVLRNHFPIQFPYRLEEMPDLRFLRSQITSIMHFFSQLVFKITKVVSLKMVTNMYRYLGANVHPNICKLVSTEISVWREIIHSINTFPDKTVLRNHFPIQFPYRLEEMPDLRFLRSQITSSLYVLCCVRLFVIQRNDKICHSKKR